MVDATETIARVMEEKGVTRAELAKRIGKSRAFVTQILGGDQNITLRTLADVLYALDCGADIQATPLLQYGADVRSSGGTRQAKVNYPTLRVAKSRAPRAVVR